MCYGTEDGEFAGTRDVGRGDSTQGGNFPPWVPIPLFLAAAAAYKKTIGKKDKLEGSKGILEGLKLPFVGGKTDEEEEEQKKAKTGGIHCSASNGVDCYKE